MNHFERGAIMRAPSAEVRAGGKGIDAARVALGLGKKSLLMVLVGDVDSEQYCNLLREEKIEFEATEYKGNIRVATMYHEENSPVATIINEEGPTIEKSEWETFLRDVERKIEPGHIVASMGSYPHGVTEKNLSQLVELVHKKGSLLLVDTAPHYLRWAIDHGVDIVSPNLDEAEAVISNGAEDIFLGESTNGRQRAEEAALKLCEMGAKVAIVHAGELGSALAFDKNSFFVPQVDVAVTSVVGAGDSLAAGFSLKSEEQGDVTKLESIDWKLSLEYGSATAAAACEKGRSGEVDADRVATLFAELTESTRR
jgi:fructose-1-phosphate kinase PfkB-like protein